jgi:outer membrane autotransporter protein
LLTVENSVLSGIAAYNGKSGSKVVITDSKLMGNIVLEGGNALLTLNNSMMSGDKVELNTSTGTFNNSTLTLGAAPGEGLTDAGTFNFAGSRVTGGWDNKGTVNLKDGSLWTVTGAAADATHKLDALNANGSTLTLDGGDLRTAVLTTTDSATNLLNGSLTADVLVGAGDNLVVVGQKADGSLGGTLTADTAAGNFRVLMAPSATKAAADALNNQLDTQVVNFNQGDATITGITSDIGTRQYAVGADGKLQRVNGVAASARAAMNAMAAPAASANAVTGVIASRLDTTRQAGHRDNGGVWMSGLTGKDNLSSVDGGNYSLKHNGFALGADTRLDARNEGDGYWLVGGAFTRGTTSMTQANGSGNVTGSGVQGYLSRRYDNGVFIDGTAGITRYAVDHTSTPVQGGDTYTAGYTTMGYGASVKGGYAWKHNDWFVTPYLKAGTLTLDGVDYTTSGGMTVRNDSYTSLRGEAGVDLGMTYNFSGTLPGSVTPSLRLAALNEFSGDNSVTLNGDRFNNSTRGSAFTTGAGVSVALDNGPGLWLNVDHTSGKDISSPWLLNAGVSWTW